VDLMRPRRPPARSLRLRMDQRLGGSVATERIGSLRYGSGGGSRRRDSVLRLAGVEGASLSRWRDSCGGAPGMTVEELATSPPGWDWREVDGVFRGIDLRAGRGKGAEQEP
jgi:hypothetical protein